MAKIVNISEIHPTLGFTEFDILEKYRKSFNESELGKLHSVFPFECMAKAAGLSDRRLGRRNIFSPSAKIALMVLKAYSSTPSIIGIQHDLKPTYAKLKGGDPEQGGTKLQIEVTYTSFNK